MIEPKYVFITGCSSGIGLALARALNEHGFEVIASCRKKEDVRKLKEIDINAIHMDLADSISINNGVKQLLQITEGRLYALINNGAYGQPGAVEDLSRVALQQQFETNVFGTHELTRLLIPVFRQQGQGRIIQISSILGFICAMYRGAYCASKYALEALTDTMRMELHDTNIKLSLIEPGPIDTNFRDNAYQAYQAHIDSKESHYRQEYQRVIDRLQGQAQMKGTLPASALVKPVLHALTADKPKIRYRVNTVTKLAAPLKRLLPDRIIDKILIRNSH